MKKFKVALRIEGICGSEVREMVVSARNKETAIRAAERRMGNRDHCIEGVYAMPLKAVSK